VQVIDHCCRQHVCNQIALNSQCWGSIPSRTVLASSAGSPRTIKALTASPLASHLLGRHRLPLRQGFGVKNTFQATGDVLLDRNQIGKSWHSAEQSGLWNKLCARQNGDDIAQKIKPRSSEQCRLKKECHENVNYVFFVRSNACRRVSSAIGMRSRF
jgi:hypothetical protein